ncbi:sugar MFS transporter [Mucilaginibacter gynuensis]|uniref:Sugar MFS transporter n=1 Tax=Mucilaginibacter gynuensis TaxID=1302236 RepID=A0ABP8GAF2_9SPHI
MAKNQPASTNYTLPLVTLTSLFFMWGFITCMNDVLIPHLKELFKLSYTQSMLIQFCFFGAYFIGSLIYFFISYYKGDPINRIGYKNGILLGLLVSAIGCALFYPAATAGVYGLFLAALFVLGLGFTLLQIAANAYVSLLGSPESASSRLNLTQAFNALGTTIAPVLGGFLILQFFSDNGVITAASTRMPYLTFAGIFLLLMLLIYRVKLPQFASEEMETQGLGALKFMNLKLGVVAIFCYVGAEVAIGSFIISLLKHGDIAGLDETVSKNYLALYWGGAMLGRFLGAISLNQSLSAVKKILYMVVTAVLVFGVIFSIVDLSFAQIQPFLIFIVINLLAFLLGKSSPGRTLLLFASVNVVLLLITVFTGGHTAMWSVIAIGLFNSIMYSNIYTLAIADLGKYTSQGSSLLVMAILGGAVFPLAQGALTDVVGIQTALLLPVLNYLYLIFFGYYCWRKFSHVTMGAAKGGH